MVVNAPPAAPLRDVTMRSVSVGGAAKTLDLENVEGLKLEKVTVGGQQIDGTLTWRTAGANQESVVAWNGKAQ